MSKSNEGRLADIGKRLSPSLQKDALLKILKQAATLLTEIEQSPLQSTVTAMKACTEALVLPGLLRHKDKEVRLLVATCVSEIMRIVAPEAPYEDDVLKDIFQLIVAIFQGLNEVSSSSFPKRVNILETVAKVRSCVVMLDLECDDLILEMFHVFFNTASDEHPQNVFIAMRNILALVLEESEEVSQPLLEAVLSNILKDNKDVSPAAYRLAVAVVERCADKLEPYVQKFLTSVMLEGKRPETELQEDYHGIIYEIYRCAPQMLLAVIPNLTQELVTDQVDVRLKAVELLGRLFALPGRHVAQEYKQLFSEFLKRFSDKAVEVRLAVVACAKACLEANPVGPEAQDILSQLQEHLLDFDDKVRMSVVKSLCDLVNLNPKWVPIQIIKRVSERLRDKKVSVRKDTLKLLADVYRTYTNKCNEGLLPIDMQFEWIPSKIVRCCYDKDIRPQSIELVFTDDLFSADLPVEQRAKHWIAMMASFDKNDEKAFRNILGQKQRLQAEMQNFLGMRVKSKDEDTPELQKKIQASFKTIGASFIDPAKAEENLQKLHQMKDNNIFKSLNILLSPSTVFKVSQATRDDLLKRIGEKHPQHDFILTLATKCSFLLFNKEHAKSVLKEVTTNKLSGNKEYVAASLSLLVEFAGFFPALLEGTEGDLLELLKESDEAIKEGVVHVLAKAGGSIRDHITEKESKVDLTLEQLCLEGNRKQAKHAVSAIAAISADSGLKALSVLYGRLVDLLDDKSHLPTILQSLGCIAENAIPVFETREEEVVRFVVRNLLKRESVQREGWKPDWDNPSEECLLKIYGVKCLVKSFLPHKDAQLRNAKFKGLLAVVAKLLTSGDVSDDSKSSDIDKANLRLAAGKAVLRLARRWDAQISPSIVHSTLSLALDPSIEVRQKFVAKVHQYLKERALQPKYACVFALVAVDPLKALVQDGKRFLADFVETTRREARNKQVSLSAQIEGTTITLHPEYVLTYLVHFHAHQPQFPSERSADVSAFEQIYRQLAAYLRALVHQDGDGRSDTGKKEDVENIPAILAIFRSLKNAEVTEKEKSENLYALCDIGIVIIKELGKKKHFSGEYPASIPLPPAFYKTVDAGEGQEVLPAKIDGSHLPDCFTNKDVLAKFQVVSGGPRAAQPSSPRGNKRDRRTVDGDSSSDEDQKEEEIERQSKKTRHTEVVDETIAELGKDDTVNATSARQAQGRKKANGDSEKNGIVKAATNPKKDDEESSPKRKRGRPKASTVKTTMSGEASEDSASAVRKHDDSVEKGKGKKQVVEKPQAKKESLESPKATAKKNPVRGLKVATEDPVKGEGLDGTKMGSGREKRSAEATRSPLANLGKIPMKQITVVEKSPAARTQTEPKEERLIGCKVKVWWPLDQRFYKGEIVAYDSRKNKHKVLYDDGETENLLLANEKWELMAESRRALKKVPVEKPTAASPSSNQSGKLKRKSPGQAVDNGSQSPGPSDKKRAIAKVGKETSSQTLQGVGRGLAQAKSGSLSTPSKNAKNSASISAGPFAFSDDDYVDEPASDKGGKKVKGTSASKSPGAASVRGKRNAEGKPKELVEKMKEGVEETEKLTGKVQAEKIREKVKGKKQSEKGKEIVDREKPKDTMEIENSKGKPESEKPKDKVETIKPKPKLDIEKPKGKADSEKPKGKADNENPRDRGIVEKGKGDIEKTKDKDKMDIEKSKLKSDIEKPKDRAEGEKSKGKIDSEKPKDKVEIEKSRGKVDSEKPKDKVESWRPKEKMEIEKGKGKSDSEKPKTKGDSEKTTKLVELEKPKAKIDAEKSKAKLDSEKPKGKLESEKVKLKDPEKSKVESTKVKDKVLEEKLKENSPEVGMEVEETQDTRMVEEEVSSDKKGDQILEVSKKDTSASKKDTAEAQKDDSMKDAEGSKKVTAGSKDTAVSRKEDDDDNEPLGTWRSRKRK